MRRWVKYICQVLWQRLKYGMNADLNLTITLFCRMLSAVSLVKGNDSDDLCMYFCKARNTWHIDPKASNIRGSLRFQKFLLKYTRLAWVEILNIFWWFNSQDLWTPSTTSNSISNMVVKTLIHNINVLQCLSIYLLIYYANYQELLCPWLLWFLTS